MLVQFSKIKLKLLESVELMSVIALKNDVNDTPSTYKIYILYII